MAKLTKIETDQSDETAERRGRKAKTEEDRLQEQAEAEACCARVAEIAVNKQTAIAVARTLLRFSAILSDRPRAFALAAIMDTLQGAMSKLPPAEGMEMAKVAMSIASAVHSGDLVGAENRLDKIALNPKL